MYTPVIRCKECDSVLWSYHAKQMGICPDCEDVDSDNYDDLETKLDNLLEQQ